MLELIKWALPHNVLTKCKLPYPEEAPFEKPLDISARALVKGFLEAYKVPGEYHDYWLDDVVSISNPLVILYRGVYINAPAATFDRKVRLDGCWLNNGVLAHEFAHISYSLMPLDKRYEFNNLFKTSAHGYWYVHSMFMQKPYGYYNPVEGHADMFRYLGKDMPDVFKKYYPRLI